MIALDTETFLISPGCLAPPLVCVSVSDGTLYHVNEALPHVAELIKGPLVGHNVAYDMAVLMSEFPSLVQGVFDAYDQDLITDTLLREKLIDIARGQLGGAFVRGRWTEFRYGLADIAKRRLGLEVEKGQERVTFAPLRDLPLDQWPEEHKEYAVKDAVVTLSIWQDQESADILLRDQYRQSRAAFALHLASCWGMVTDPHAIARLKANTEGAYEAARRTLMDAGIVRPNGSRDTKAAKKLMLEAMGEAEIKRTKTYLEIQKKAEEAEASEAELAKLNDPLFGVALDEEACVASGHPLLQAYADLSSLMTIVETHIPALLNGTRAPIQPRFNSLVETGRTSCKGHDETGPTYGYQVQNVSRAPGIRECFIPRPGYVYVSADYSGLELHTWAQCCLWIAGFSALAEALNAGKDAHVMLATNLTGLSYSELEAKIKAGDEEAKEARQFAKIGNFGLQGGMGVSTFIKWSGAAYGKKLSLAQAESIKEAWKSTWPEHDPYFRHVSEQVREGGGEATITQFLSERVRGGLTFTVAANSPFQGLGADLAKEAFYVVQREAFVGRLQGSRAVNFVHDEIILETPEDLVTEHAQVLAEIMVSVGSKWLPNVHPKAEPCAMRRWSKKAKTIWENGRLVPWDEDQ